jgi:hypothetical protein
MTAVTDREGAGLVRCYTVAGQISDMFSCGSPQTRSYIVHSCSSWVNGDVLSKEVETIVFTQADHTFEIGTDMSMSL